MADAALDPRTQLCHRPAISLRDEERVVPEPSPPHRSNSDGAGAVGLKSADEPTAGRQGQAADITGAAFRRRNLRHRAEKLCVVCRVILRRPREPGRSNAGPATQCLNLKAGILRQNKQDRPAGDADRFLDGVLAEGAAGLGNRWDAGKLIQQEEAHRKTGKEPAKFPNLVAVPGGDKNGDRHDKITEECLSGLLAGEQ